ncbi:MAG: sugar phosphate isomerase/epimerase [Victivallales bacterium]
MYKIFLSGQMFDAFPVEVHLDAARDFGYDGIQLRSTHAKPDTPREELDGILASGLPINALSCFVGNYGVISEEKCREAFDIFVSYVRLAVKMGTNIIRVWPAWQESASAPFEVWRRAAKWIKKSADFAADHGIKLAMEMHHGTLCDGADSSLKLLEMINCPNVGIILDAVNLYQVPADYGPAAIRKLGKYIFDVHVKDIIRLEGNYSRAAFAYSYYAKHIGRFTPVVPPDLAAERFYAHRRINQGGIDWTAVVFGLKEISYTGTLTVESVSENNFFMPSGRNLAEVCINDVKEILKSMEKQND